MKYKSGREVDPYKNIDIMGCYCNGGRKCSFIVSPQGSAPTLQPCTVQTPSALISLSGWCPPGDQSNLPLGVIYVYCGKHGKRVVGGMGVVRGGHGGYGKPNG